MSSKPVSWFARWQHLAGWERKVLVQLMWRLSLVWLYLRLRGFRQCYLRFACMNKPGNTKLIPPGYSPEAYADGCAALMSIAARRGLYQANCLHRSLALCGWLHKTGIDAVLRIGMIPGSLPFEAHAWLELDSRALGGEAVGRYETFDQLQPALARMYFQ